ncbi:MAG: MFS transporter, partial [Planctomycetota bacterium]
GFMLLLAGGAYRPLAKRLSEATLLSGGVCLVIIGLGLVGCVAWFVARGTPGDRLQNLFYLASALAVAGFAGINPSVSALISRRADAERQGEVLGVNQSFASLARIVGPLTGMSLFSLHPSHVLPYAASMVLLLAVAAIVPRLTKERAASRTA